VANCRYTLETGELGLNTEAAEHIIRTRGMAGSATTAVSELVNHALHDRTSPIAGVPSHSGGDSGSKGIPAAAVTTGILPLWLDFVQGYEQALPVLELDSAEAETLVRDLAGFFSEWRLEIERLVPD
jgi:hypothetical protein